MKKRIFSRLMAMFMAAALLSTSAFAAVFTQDSIDADGNLKLTEDNDYSYHLESDVELEQTVKIGSGVDATIDLNGWTLRHTGETGSVIAVTDGGKLTLTDTDENENHNEDGVGTITGGKGMDWTNAWGNNCPRGGGLYVEGEGSEFTMRGGNISENEAYQGGGIYAAGKSSLVIEGGSITGNTSQSSGGGIYMVDSGTVMKGGTISNNTAVKGHGGGVDAYFATFTMESGTISENVAGWSGGGIYGDTNSTVTINGGEISQNAGSRGAGITTSMGTVYLNGGTIAGNKGVGIFAATAGKVHLSGGIFCANSGEATSIDETSGSQIITPDTSTTIIYDSHKDEADAAIPATCTTAGLTAGSHCADCGMVIVKQGVIPATGHQHTELRDTKAATCTGEGYTGDIYCNDCNTVIEKGEAIPVVEHIPGEVVRENEIPAGVGTEGSYDEVVYCDVCHTELSRESYDIEALPVPVPPVVDVDFPGTGAAADTTIDDETTPLAGIVTEAQLLDELYKHEGSPAVELVEKYASHEYALAISWALANAVVVDSEDFDPDEAVTVALLREVLTGYVAYKGIDFTVTVTGEDDELVLDLSECLNVFFAQLEK